MKNLITVILIVFLLILISEKGFSQTVLTANGPGDTYELINSVFAPTGGDVVESAECVHPEFGRHIAEVWDEDLDQYVFEFYIHVTPDNDRCINFDRQRVEIKTYESSPDYLKGVSGETVVYKWRFKVPTGFQPSSSFTHIHQVKAVGGDEADPIFVLTARKGSPNKLELNYYSDSDLSSSKLTTANLSLFENTWVEATERIKLDSINGTYSLTIKKVSDSTTIMSYSNNKLLTIRADNSFVRPKWGIYRSLNTPSDLRDESLRFNSFSIYEEPATKLIQPKADDNFNIKTDSQSKIISISYILSEKQNVSICLYDLNGKKIKNIQQIENQSAGNYSCQYDYSKLTKGVYLISILTNNYANNTKVIL